MLHYLVVTETRNYNKQCQRQCSEADTFSTHRHSFFVLKGSLTVDIRQNVMQNIRSEQCDITDEYGQMFLRKRSWKLSQ